MAGNSESVRKGWETRRARRSAEAPETSEEASIALAEATRVMRAQASGGIFSGLKINLQSIDEEYVPELRTLQGRLGVFQRMANDSDIKAVLRGNVYPLISAVRWDVEGGDPKARELVKANLLRKGPRQFWCDTSWNQRLYEMTLCLQNGFSAFGKTREIVDGKMIFRKLTWLHPRSFSAPLGAWEFDDAGNLVAVHRSYQLPSGATESDDPIAAEDLAIYVWEMAGQNWEGTALIRPGYKDWKMKELAEKIGMVHLQNVGVGIPKGTLAAQSGSKDRDRMIDQAMSLRGGSKERQALVMANGETMDFLTADAGTDLASPMVNLHREGISAIGSMQFQGAGNAESGSRAQGSVDMVHYLQMVEAVKVVLQDQINHGAGEMQGLVEELTYENFGPDAECPEIKGSCVSPTEQLDNIPIVGELVQRGLIPPTLRIANEALKRLGWPEMTPKEWEESRAASQIGGRPGEVHPIDQNNPRADNLGRQYGLKEREKWLHGGSLLPKRNPSWPWLKSVMA